jgi:hypothetical protein
VQLELDYPDAARDLNRWLSLVKWLLAIPYYLILLLLDIGVLLAVIGAWFAILFTRRYPRGIFDFVVGVMRWHNRVGAYAFVLIADRYPPFRLARQFDEGVAVSLRHKPPAQLYRFSRSRKSRRSRLDELQATRSGSIVLPWMRAEIRRANA